MQTINSGNRKFYVIHFIYFSSMETEINFLLVFSLLGSWSGVPLGYKNFHWFWGVIFG